jgi:hypothetical protein
LGKLGRLAEEGEDIGRGADAIIKGACSFSGDTEVATDDYSYFARGKVYALQGEKDKALADFDKYGQLAKDYNSQQDLTRELQALQNK